ncbi:hypothetical protein D3C72_1821280 [compost metagenome]
MLRCFGEYVGAVLTSKNMSVPMRIDAAFVLCSGFLPLFSLFGLPLSIFALIPGWFPAATIAGSAFYAWAMTLGIVLTWSVTVSWKRDRTINPIPGLRYLVFALHWIPALLMAMRNIILDQPVVWAKTEHVGHGTAPVATPQLAGVGAAETHPAA